MSLKHLKIGEILKAINVQRMVHYRLDPESLSVSFNSSRAESANDSRSTNLGTCDQVVMM